MDCKGIQDQLVDFLYGELDPPARQAFERHLLDCPDCAEQIAGYRDMLTLVRAQPREEPSSQVSERILHGARTALSVESEQKQASGKKAWWSWLASPVAAAAVLALVVGSVGLVNYLGDRASAPSLEADRAVRVRPDVPVSQASDGVVADATAAKAKAAGHAPLPAGPAPVAKLDAAFEPRKFAENAPAAKRPKAIAPAPEPALHIEEGFAPAKPRAGATAKQLPGSAPSGRRLSDSKDRAGSLRTKKRKAKKARLRSAMKDSKPTTLPTGTRTDFGAQAADKGTARGMAGTDPSSGLGGVLNGQAGSGRPGKALTRPQPDVMAGDGAATSDRVERSAPADLRFAQPPPPSRAPAEMAKRPDAKPARRPMLAEKKRPADQRPDPAPADEMALQDSPSPARELAPQMDDADLTMREESMDAEAESVVIASSGASGGGRAKAHARRGPQVDYHAQAERAMSRKQYRVAALGFREYLAHSPSGPKAIAARFRLAKALFLAGQCDQAIRAAAEAIRRAPRHGQAADALFDQASCQVKLGRFDAAARTYRRIEREHPGRAGAAQRELDRIQPAAVPASDR